MLPSLWNGCFSLSSFSPLYLLFSGLLSNKNETLGITFRGLEEMFEGDGQVRLNISLNLKIK